MHFDTLIIGAGVSGLAAGIRLAYFERPVCIVERHTTIGGLNSFYRLRRRNYDVGLHAVTNYAPPGTRTGPLSKLLRQLRLSWDDFRLVPQNGSRIAFPGTSLRFGNDFDLLVSQVAEAFPTQVNGFRRLAWFLEEQDLGGVADSSLTARTVMARYLTEPRLIDMLLCPLMFYGSPTPDDMEFTQFGIMFRSIFREGLARPREGVRLILKRLVRRYKELGGELRLRAGVREILTDGRRATGVVLDDGSTMEADRVVSSAGHVETMCLCRADTNGESSHGNEPAAGQITFAETIATLDCQPADLGHSDTLVFYCNSPSFTYANPAEPCDVTSGIICSPNNFAYDEPLPEGVIRMTALANNRTWMTLADDDYSAAKATWHDKIVASALGHIPDFRSRVVDTDMFTPRTIRKYTGHINGCVYGAPQKAWDGTTHLENLFLCGTDQGYLGIVGAMLSGISMANRHVLRQT